MTAGGSTDVIPCRQDERLENLGEYVITVRENNKIICHIDNDKYFYKRFEVEKQGGTDKRNFDFSGMFFEIFS
jgi:hypothetical protein